VPIWAGRVAVRQVRSRWFFIAWTGFVLRPDESLDLPSKQRFLKIFRGLGDELDMYV